MQSYNNFIGLDNCERRKDTGFHSQCQRASGEGGNIKQRGNVIL